MFIPIHFEKIIARFLLAVTSFASLHAEQSMEEAFSIVYQNRTWGPNADGEGSSGGGSSLSTTETYRSFLANFFKTHDIQSVVDVGCGDWEFSRTINWDGIEYNGYDVVESLISNNTKNYSAPNIHFFKEDALSIDLPPADLLICKDVLPHLSNKDIIEFFKQLPKFRYCLITIDLAPNAENNDIRRGDFRFLDLSREPFSINGEQVLTFPSVPYTKQVLLIIP